MVIFSAVSPTHITYDHLWRARKGSYLALSLGSIRFLFWKLLKRSLSTLPSGCRTKNHRIISGTLTWAQCIGAYVSQHRQTFSVRREPASSSLNCTSRSGAWNLKWKNTHTMSQPQTPMSTQIQGTSNHGSPLPFESVFYLKSSRILHHRDTDIAIIMHKRNIVFSSKISDFLKEVSLEINVAPI